MSMYARDTTLCSTTYCTCKYLEIQCISSLNLNSYCTIRYFKELIACYNCVTRSMSFTKGLHSLKIGQRGNQPLIISPHKKVWYQCTFSMVASDSVATWPSSPLLHLHLPYFRFNVCSVCLHVIIKSVSLELESWIWATPIGASLFPLFSTSILGTITWL